MPEELDPAKLWTSCDACNKETALADIMEGTVERVTGEFCLQCIQKDPRLPAEFLERAKRGVIGMRARRVKRTIGQRTLGDA